MKSLNELNSIKDDNLGDIPTASPSTPLRDPVCDRNMVEAFLETMFPLTVRDDGTSPSDTITTRVVISGLTYSLRFKKLFGIVFITGRLSTTAGGSLNSQTIFNITDSRYIPQAGYSQNVHGIREDNTGAVIQLQFQSSGQVKIFHTGSLPIGIGYNFNGFYYVED